MPDGSPQLTQTWADTDGTHILINTVETHQKTRNVRRDPRVAVAISDPQKPSPGPDHPDHRARAGALDGLTGCRRRGCPKPSRGMNGAVGGRPAFRCRTGVPG
ncbi:pyridoxamine 5'-phosphate oxidase family protein [Micromonospora sp. LAH09]|nr:pyridoxamine 5'-phosphate oxidase family protein [Micromonospora cabrerizensis]